MSEEQVVSLEDEVQEVQSKIGSRVGVAARLITQGKSKFYSSTLTSDVLRDTCSVDMRAEDAIKGFQRRLDQRRAQSIANYINSGGTIPSSVILSAQSEARLKYTSRSQVLSFKRVPRAFLILDGQHRVNGFYLAEGKIRVPVIIYNDLSKEDEVALFMDINTTQKPVPNELLLDIKRLAQRESTEEAFLRDLYYKFNDRNDSPLFGLMSPFDKEAGKISHVTFNAALKAVFEAIGTADSDYVYSVLQAYIHAWLAGLRNVGSEMGITDPTLFRAIMLVFPDVADRISNRSDADYTVDNFNDALQPLFKKLRKNTIQNLTGSHLIIAELFRKQLVAGFTLRKPPSGT